MQLKNLIFAAATAAALPATDAATNQPFGVISIHSGSGVQYAPFNAALGSIFAGLKSQNASCSNPQDQTATFVLDNGALYLYDQSATPQELYVDRSGMGQGKIGYTTGAQPAPKNGERQGWSIDKNNHLQFGGKDLIACPNSIQGAWSIWADAGVEKPGWNEGCEGIAARVEYSKNPNVCSYTSN